MIFHILIDVDKAFQEKFMFISVSPQFFFSIRFNHIMLMLKILRAGEEVLTIFTNYNPSTFVQSVSVFFYLFFL